MLEGVIEQQAAAGLPVTDLVVDAQPAPFPVTGHGETQVATNHGTGRSLVRRDVIVGREDRKPGVLQTGKAFYGRSRDRAALAVLVQADSEDVERERLPVVALGDAFLVG